MTNKDHIPMLVTPRLTLRPFTENDVAPLHRILHQPNILEYYPNPEAPSIERVKDIINRQFTQWDENDLGWWAVVPNREKELIGWNGLQYLPETDEVEVGYLLSRQFWCKGYATEGAKASLKYGFDNFKFKEIIGLTYPKNTASQHVLKKCGLKFTRQAVFRHSSISIFPES